MVSMQEKLLDLALKTNTPVGLFGMPGTAKSAIVRKIVKDRDGVLYLFQVAQRDPVDLTGAMHPVEVTTIDGDTVTVTRYSTPEWVHIANEQAKAGRFVVIFMDEITTAAPMSLNATLTLVQDRQAGEYNLHPEIRFVIAGNPPGTNAGVYELPAAFANRIFHIDWTMDVDGWGEWVVVPGNIKTTGDEKVDAYATDIVAPIVVQFLKATNNLLNFPKHETEQGEPWASPRSWEQAIRNLASLRVNGTLDYDTNLFALKGLVGQGVATEFMSYERDLDLPDPEAVLKDPLKIKLPTKQDQLFVMLAQVTGRVMQDFTAERNVAAWQVLGRVAEEFGATDIAATHARTLAERIWNEPDKSKLGDFGKYLAPFIPMLKEANLYKGGK